MKNLIFSLLLITTSYAIDRLENAQICFINKNTGQIGVCSAGDSLNFPIVPVQAHETSDQATKSWLTKQKLPACIKDLCTLTTSNTVTYFKLAAMTDNSSKLNKYIVWGPFLEKPNQNQKPLAPEIIAMQNLMTCLLEGARMQNTTDAPHDISTAENYFSKALEDFAVLVTAYGEGVTGKLTLDPSFRDLYARTYVQSKVRPWLDLSECCTIS